MYLKIFLLAVASLIGLLVYDHFSSSPTPPPGVKNTSSITPVAPKIPLPDEAQAPEIAPSLPGPEINSKDAEAFSPETKSPAESPKYRSVKEAVAMAAFQKFLEVYNLPSYAIIPLIVPDEFVISSLGPEINVYDATSLDGSNQMIILISEVPKDNSKLIYDYVGIDPESLNPRPGESRFFSGTDQAKETHFLIKTVRFNSLGLTYIWKKISEKHTDQQINQFQKSVSSPRQL